MLEIAAITGTRADYGLLYWLLKRLDNDNFFNLNILATGSHLSKLHGSTYKDIEEDGFVIKEKIKILNYKDEAIDIAFNTASAIKGFSKYFDSNHTDLVLILGDRYEALAASQSAMFQRIPVMHIHGGELTSGAYDDMIRHSITKMSDFHSTTTNEHMKRVIQMGEHPSRVKNFGAPGLEYLKKAKLFSKEDLSRDLGFELADFFLFTYHPETLSDMPVLRQITQILDALDSFQEYNLVFTYPNADDGGRKIIESIDSYVNQNSNRCFALPSLGQTNYLSALSLCDLVIGNSSSGLIEAPSATVPSINIGNRQQNRTSAKSVINTKNETTAIIDSINFCLSKDFKENKDIFNNPYGQGNTSEEITRWMKEIDLRNKKTFFDISF